MRTSRKLVPALAISACALAVSLAPTAASADSYVPGANNQGFATGQGGWGNSTSSTGLCVTAVNCPLITNSFQAAGGAGGGGDGFIRTSVVSVASAGATSSGIWTSPAFTYAGNGGNIPTSVTFDMQRQSDVSALLAIPGNLATYGVRLLDNSNATAVTVVAPATLAGANSWTSIPSAGINPALLAFGHSYSIEVTSTYDTVAGAVPMGNADYDNVALTTAGNAGPPGGGGAGGGAGGGGVAGAGGAGAGGAYGVCVQNAKKKIKKKKKLTAKKRKKLLKKKIKNCKTKVKKKKKVKKRK
jgi:hypothetical protein